MEMSPMHEGSGGTFRREDLEAADMIPLLGVHKTPGLKAHKSSKGLYGYVEHIITYEPSLVRSLFVCLISHDLSVCYSYGIWAYHLGWLVYSIVLMFILGFTQYPDGEYGDGSTCASNKNIDMCQLDDVLSHAKSDFNFLIGFILSGYVGATVSMWQTRRKNYASLCGTTRALETYINTYLDVHDLESIKGCSMSKEEVLQARDLMSRWCVLAYELAVLKSQGEMDSNDGRMYLERTGLLADGEWEKMCDGDRHTTVLFWICTKARRLELKKLLCSPYVVNICEATMGMRAQANDLMSSLDRDQPFPYVALCGLLVKINIFIMSTWKAVQWSVWLRSFTINGLSGKPKWWVDMISLLAWNVSYGGLYDLGYMLHNPFGSRRIDVAHEMIGAGIRKLSVGLKNCDHYPDTMESKPGTSSHKLSHIS